MPDFNKIKMIEISFTSIDFTSYLQFLFGNQRVQNNITDHNNANIFAHPQIYLHIVLIDL
jgi:hypothetical protein